MIYALLPEWDFAQIKTTVTPILPGLSVYNHKNQWKASPAKTQESLFCTQKYEARQVSIVWNTLRTTALTSCYSVAKYACPMWERSPHTTKLDPVVDDSCCCSLGCLKPMWTVYMCFLELFHPTKREWLQEKNDTTHQRHETSAIRPHCNYWLPEITGKLPSHSRTSWGGPHQWTDTSKCSTHGPECLKRTKEAMLNASPEMQSTQPENA